MSNFDMDILIENIETLRKNKQISQKQLADELGMSQPNISKALSKSDKKCFTLDQVAGIAKYFNTSIDKLMGLDQRTQGKYITPRAIGTMLAALIENDDATIIDYQNEETIYTVSYNPHHFEPICDHKTQKVSYPAIYFPSYWYIPDGLSQEEESELVAEMYQVGNDTRMLPLNEFLLRFKEILGMYKNHGLSKETYETVLADLLNHLRDK